MPRGKFIHFMGAGGIGVSALAAMAKESGATVTACDRAENAMTRMLTDMGIPVLLGHDPKHVTDADLLVHTSAVRKSDPELLAAREAETRGQFLARLMNRHEAWGISGTHGKTTTSWLLASILIGAGMDPSVFIGGVVPGLGGMNYRLGSGPFVAELDESDSSFLLPRLKVAIITNIESEHLSHYGDDASLFSAFRSFASGVADDGLLVLGTDNPVCAEIFATHQGRMLSFGLNENGDFSARNLRYTGDGTRFELMREGTAQGEFSLTLTGEYNVRNALAALAAAVGMGVDADVARAALADATGVERRMERLGLCGDAAVYTDYAHHPTEVASAIGAFRQRHRGRTLVVFQPHLYTRTRDYARAFGEALGLAESVLLLDIYPAREDPIPGVDSALLIEGAVLRGARVNGPVPVSRAAEEVRRLSEGCEAILMMGAGDIDGVARGLARTNS